MVKFTFININININGFDDCNNINILLYVIKNDY